MKNPVFSHIWHPFTQMKTSPPPLKVRSGKGALLELEDGRHVIDAISSWWVNLHGHAHPAIAEAIYQQALRLEQVIFAGFTHDPAEQLAEQLMRVLPKPLKKVFFSDNGSTAVEVALKQAYQYWRNLGELQRRSFICFEGAYHGDTIGAMSLGARSIFSHHFEDLLFDVKTVPFPSTFEGDATVEEKENNSLNRIEELLNANPSNYAAMIVEPLVQGAGGMQMCRPIFLEKLQALTRRYGLLSIYDEVMTGFGRTGDWFACIKAKTEPDIICLAKGLTGGFLPMAVTVCTDVICDAFCSENKTKTFFHGHSYTANPLGCAAGLASLTLLHDSQHTFKEMEQLHRHFAKNYDLPAMTSNIRYCGTIAAMDVTNKAHKAGSLYAGFIREGVLLRPLGQTVYILPPYCITDDELERVYKVISAVASV